MTRKRRLGRGLEALLGAPAEPDAEPRVESEPTILPMTAQPPDTAAGNRLEKPLASVGQGNSSASILQLNVYEIDDNPFQPRRDFSEPEIASLSESLKEHDMLQPVLVRRVDDRYQLISGERRLRAAIQAGWSTVPARLREADDRLVAELAIVENLQRKDLNPIEKALSFRRYLDEHRCSQEDLAGRLKIDRSTIANLVRLLELPDLVQDALRKRMLTAGHARALLPLGEEHLQIEFCNLLQKERWSVRETEHNVQQRIRQEDSESDSSARQEPQTKRTPNQQIESLEQELRMALGTKVEIRLSRGGRGKITIHFQNRSEFERLRDQLVDGSAVEGQRQAS